MTKERIILALIAIATGAIITSSIFYFYQQKRTTTDSSSPSTAQLTPSQNGKVLLELESPQHESVTDAKTTQIKGKTQANAIVVIATTSEDFVLTAAADGVFSKTIDLEEDENIITITAYPENGTTETKEIIVSYTTEEF